MVNQKLGEMIILLKQKRLRYEILPSLKKMLNYLSKSLAKVWLVFHFD